jgi:hypothetical protein
VPSPAAPPPAEIRCTAGAVREADDGCNTCSCAPEGHWICGDLPCPGCREPYTGSDATIAPEGKSCNQGEVWVRHPEARLCCRYSGPCTAPVSWRSFRSEAECREELGTACTPGTRKHQPRARCDELCSPFGLWQPVDCRPERFWAFIDFGVRSSAPSGTGQRELDNLAGRVVAYRITRLKLEPYAAPAEANGERAARMLAVKRARAIRDALVVAGVSAGVFEIAEPRLCSGSASCTGVRATSETLTVEQLEAGHAYSPRWKTCGQQVLIRSELSVAGNEGAITFELCRNDRCSRITESARRLSEWPGSTDFTLQGAVHASLVLTPTLEQIERVAKYPLPWPGTAEYRVELRDHAPATELAQGDRYRFALYKPGRTDPYRLLEWTAGYAEIYPNGREHDPVPCRLASVDVPLRTVK